ncbi:MAG: NAD-dependent epimerase/dehydratase family protein [Bacteroidia bacterium]
MVAQKKILILGNLGYIGPELTKRLRSVYPGAFLIGFDIGYFSNHYTTTGFSPDNYLDVQYYGDVRDFNKELLDGVHAVVALAAISNDPIGNKFEQVTQDINCEALVRIAQAAKEKSVASFVFASSCSVYGFAEEGARTEGSELNPLSAYARSKVLAETKLKPLASNKFSVTCLRFATACGMSDRLRLDLVLNDFVAGAMSQKKISILSDGTPLRPLIHVKDMARAIDWAMERRSGGDFLIVNAGSNEWNYSVKELADAVSEVFPGTEVTVNKNAQPDKRSYKVNFDLFAKLAPEHQPRFSLKEAILDLKKGLEEINFRNADFRNSNLVRLNVINGLIDDKKINADLRVIR